jgi:hypothetical protein
VVAVAPDHQVEAVATAGGRQARCSEVEARRGEERAMTTVQIEGVTDAAATVRTVAA